VEAVNVDLELVVDVRRAVEEHFARKEAFLAEPSKKMSRFGRENWLSLVPGESSAGSSWTTEYRTSP